MPSLAPVKCGICGAIESRRLHEIRGLQIVQCTRCNLLYTNPRSMWDYRNSTIPLEKKLAIYERDYWPKRQVSAKRFWGVAETFRQNGRLLDIGCGFGFFLSEAHMCGWSVTGVEVSVEEASWGRDRFNLPIVSSLEDRSLDRQGFDVITLWDVIEHIADVRPLLHRCRELLRPGGGLFLRTPNADGLLIKPDWWSWVYLQFYWQLVYPANPIEHVYHFTPSVLEILLEQNGFKVRSIQTNQDWDERVLVGRNHLVTLARTILMWIAWKNHLPYEIGMWAEKT